MHKHTALILAILAALFAAGAIFVASGKLRSELMPEYGSSMSSSYGMPSSSSSEASFSSSEESGASSINSSHSSEDSSYAARACGGPGDVNCGGSCPSGKTCQFTRSSCSCR